MSGDEKTLRSAGWFGDEWHQGFVSRGWTKNQGHPEQMFDGRPVIGICNTWSDLNPCNAHLRILAGQCWLRKSPGQRHLIWAVVLVAVVLCGARTIVRNRDWHSDARLFAAVLSHYPDNARAHDNLAFAYYQQGQYARAFHHYQRAVAIQPTRLRAHFNLGILHSAARRYEEAIASFKNALVLNPTHVETHFNLGLTYQKAGRYEEAIGHYGTVLNLAPHHLKTHYNLGRAYERVGRIEDAIRQYTALVALNPEATKAYYRLGELYRRQQRREEMAAAWTTLLRLDPAHREAERIRQALTEK